MSHMLGINPIQAGVGGGGGTMCVPWQHFCKGALGQNFQFFRKNCLFLTEKVQRLKIDPLCQIGHKIRELKFLPGTILKNI